MLIERLPHGVYFRLSEWTDSHEDAPRFSGSRIQEKNFNEFRKRHTTKNPKKKLTQHASKDKTPGRKRLTLMK
jgi:hypothetical protein